LTNDYTIVKIGDLDFIKLKETSMATKSFFGTPFYMSPEMIQREKYSYETDIWSAGCVLFEMITLRKAFEQKDKNLLIETITKEDPLTDDLKSSPFYELLVRMLEKDPKKRSTSKQLLNVS
jgi:serine/threonine protein kinase